MNKRTILILTVVVDLLISGIAVFGLKLSEQTNMELSEASFFEELRKDHLLELESGNPESLKLHASKLWTLFEDTEAIRISESEAYASGFKVILWAVWFHFFATIVGLTIRPTEPRELGPVA